MSIYYCENCCTQHDNDHTIADEAEAGLVCEESADAEFEKERAYWEPRYCGELIAGLHRPNGGER